MKNEPYGQPFHWSWRQLVIAIIIILVLILLVLGFITPSSFPMQGNIIRNL